MSAGKSRTQKETARLSKAPMRLPGPAHTQAKEPGAPASQLPRIEGGAGDSPECLGPGRHLLPGRLSGAGPIPSGRGRCSLWQGILQLWKEVVPLWGPGAFLGSVCRHQHILIPWMEL